MGRGHPNKRRLDNYQVVEWVVTAKEQAFPKKTNGKQLVREWQVARYSLQLASRKKP